MYAFFFFFFSDCQLFIWEHVKFTKKTSLQQDPELQRCHLSSAEPRCTRFTSTHSSTELGMVTDSGHGPVAWSAQKTTSLG